jgi:hypothetical protein
MLHGNKNESRKAPLISSVLALILAVCVSASIIAINLTSSPYLTAEGPYSTRDRIIYTTISTIIATFTTTFISSRIRALWICRLDELLYDHVQNRRSVSKLSKTWRTVLSVGEIKETLQNLTVLLQFVITSLITTSIVAGLAPSLALRTVSTQLEIFDGQTFPCARVEDNPLDGRDYGWDLRNGSSFFVPSNACNNIKRGVQLMANINTKTTRLYSYADVGIAVESSAIGAPTSIYSQETGTETDKMTGLQTLLTSYGSSLVNTTHCVPVMVLNPISCRRGGDVTVSHNSLTVTSSDKRCTFTSQFRFDPTRQNSMAKYMCAHDEVGQGTIVFGATYGYATFLARAVDDQEIPDDQWAPNSTYAVTCSVDTRSVYEDRWVSLVLQGANSALIGLGRSLVGGDRCQNPHGSTVKTPLIATAAAGNWQILIEFQGLDGFFESISHVIFNRKPQWAFNNSVNALEDALGLTAAQVAARIESNTTFVNGTAIFTSTRMGSGKLYAIAFIIPPLFSVLILSHLLLTIKWRNRTGFSSIRLEGFVTGQRVVSRDFETPT